MDVYFGSRPYRFQPQTQQTEALNNFAFYVKLFLPTKPTAGMS